MNSKKVAIVTGGRRGIGFGIAKELGRDNYHIIMVATAVNADKEIQELRDYNISCEYRSCDISNDELRSSLVKDIYNTHARIDVLINNAGVAPKVRLDILDTTKESYDTVMNINTRGTFFMSQQVSNLMIELKNANIIGKYNPRIINISSISAYTSSTSRSEYCISKAGISMITLLFADRLSEYLIPVFEVRPGIILTDMTEKVKETYDALIKDGITPIKRFGTPEDVANCVSALCSEKLDFATGQIINADGGFHIRRL